MKRALEKPFMGTRLTIAGAIVVLMAAPAFWLVFAIACAALPL